MPFHNLLTESPSINLDFLEIDKKGENPNLFPTLCAFLNTEGGYVFIGISRDKEIQGISEAELDNFRKTFIERSQRNKAYLNPPSDFILRK